MVIFGGTGNLTRIKLIPALYHLMLSNDLPESFKILAIGRKDQSRMDYIVKLEHYLTDNIKHFNHKTWDKLQEQIDYLVLDIAQPTQYELLSQWMNQEPQYQEVIYYFATAPDLFEVISQGLYHQQLADPQRYSIKVIIEKPFGYDLASANRYQHHLQQVFPEELIYRIDHYLGKEMVQNIMYLRFANRVFHQVWNGDNIKSIQIIADENIGIEGRGKYYDITGAMRDMLQSHLFQILTLLTIQQPTTLTNNDLLERKLSILNNIIITEQDVVFGQYDGYLQEPDVEPNSTTETFVALHCRINNPVWNNTDFYLRTGKFLDQKAIEVIIEFRELIDSPVNIPTKNNVLVIKIQPEEGVYFHFNSKEPGINNTLRTNSLSYCQSCVINYRSVEAYEYLIKEVLMGNHSAFAHWHEVALSWSLVDQMAKWKNNLPLYRYPKGSQGPQASDEMLQSHQTSWQKGKYL